MGMATDAKVIYGITIPEWDECHHFDEKFEESELYKKVVAWKKKEHEDFYIEHPEYKDEDDGFDVSSVGISELSEYLDYTIPELYLMSHCSDSCPMWILGIGDSFRVSPRGEAVSLEGLIKKELEKKDLIINFCKKWEIPADFKSGCKWYLTSDCEM